MPERAVSSAWHDGGSAINLPTVVGLRADTLVLGTWRLLLALLVVNGHLNTDWWASTFAVYSFYVISGFLITLIMNRTYGFTRRGLLSFVANRALRIYPPYYAAIAISLLAIALVPEAFIRGVNGVIRLPQTAYDVASNVAIFGLHMGQPSRLVPAAWALHIELCHYLAIAALLGRNALVSGAWLVASGVYYFQYPPRLYFETGYFSVAGSSIAFAVGACAFHARPYLRRLQRGRAASLFLLAAVIAYSMPYVAVKFYGANPMLRAFTANIVTSAVLLVALTGFGKVPARLRRLDAWLGNLSYPVYLFHQSTGVLVLYATGIAVHTPDAFVLTALATLSLAAIEARFLSDPIEKMRSGIKGRLRSGTGACAPSVSPSPGGVEIPISPGRKVPRPQD